MLQNKKANFLHFNLIETHCLTVFKMKITIVLAILLVQNNVLVLMLQLDSSENVFNESVIITNIIQEENEINDLSNEQHHKLKPRPPQYPIEILKQFEMSDKFTRFGSGDDGTKDFNINRKRTTLSQPRDRLFHVWLPVDVIGKSVMLIIFTIIKIHTNQSCGVFILNFPCKICCVLVIHLVEVCNKGYMISIQFSPLVQR